jgi:hypothetical protein
MGLHNIETLVSSSTVGSCCQYDNAHYVDVQPVDVQYVDVQYGTTRIAFGLASIPATIIVIVLLLNLLATYKCFAKCRVHAKGTGQGEAEEGEVKVEEREEEETHPYEEACPYR